MIQSLKVVTALMVLGASVVLTPIAAAQDAGETVVKRGLIKEDVYAAGESVTIDADVIGDAVVAGGDVSVAGKVSEDIIAAGGQVRIRGNIGDDVRAAGGQVDISATIGDDLIAAGGQVTLSPDTTVKGRTWLSGGDIEVRGRLGRELKVAGGSISLAALVNGDVELMGDNIRVEAGTDIRGNLVYRSNNEIYVDEQANITGSVVRKPLPYHEEWGRGGGLVMSILTIFVSVLLLSYFFPGFLGAAVESLRTRPGKSLLTGLILLVMIPVAVLLLFITAVGWLAAIVVLAMYFVAIAIATLVGVRTITEVAAGWFKQELAGSWRRLTLALALTVIAISVIGLIPVIGGLLWFLLLIGGLGAGGTELYRRYRAA